VTVRDLKIISVRYVSSFDFYIDILTLIPFVNFLKLRFGRQQLFLIIKIIRVNKFLDLFNTSEIMHKVT
jgi:hypothetical protein